MRRDDRRELGALAAAGCFVVLLNLAWITAVVFVVALIVRGVIL